MKQGGIRLAAVKQLTKPEEIVARIREIYVPNHFMSDYFHIDIDYQSLNYNRFAVHLKFFWKAMMYKKDQSSFGDLSREILNVIKNSDIEAYKCALKIKEYISEKYNYELNNEEIMYLAIHINKIVHGEEK